MVRAPPKHRLNSATSDNRKKLCSYCTHLAPQRMSGNALLSRSSAPPCAFRIRLTRGEKQARLVENFRRLECLVPTLSPCASSPPRRNNGESLSAEGPAGPLLARNMPTVVAVAGPAGSLARRLCDVRSGGRARRRWLRHGAGAETGPAVRPETGDRAITAPGSAGTARPASAADAAGGAGRWRGYRAEGWAARVRNRHRRRYWCGNGGGHRRRCGGVRGRNQLRAR